MRTAQELDKMAEKENYCGTILVDHLKALLSLGKKLEPKTRTATEPNIPNQNQKPEQEPNIQKWNRIETLEYLNGSYISISGITGS